MAESLPPRPITEATGVAIHKRTDGRHTHPIIVMIQFEDGTVREEAFAQKDRTRALDLWEATLEAIQERNDG